MTEQIYKQEEVLWIEIAMRKIQDDAVGRYIHDPNNLKRIMDVFKDMARHLLEVQTGDALKCPPGYSHKNCACTVDITTLPGSQPK
jgi:hypothetical protein